MSLATVHKVAGGSMTFKRREMASALEARTKFPQLVTGEEKRVRFVVVHGLELMERPNIPPDDAEWYVSSYHCPLFVYHMSLCVYLFVCIPLDVDLA
jgi:hypothetical protein